MARATDASASSSLPLAELVSVAPAASSCYVNGVKASDQDLSVLLRQGHPGRDGQWWYDHTSGAFGLVGGPTLKFMAPGLDLAGSLDAHCSKGSTGVFVNGRELNDLDLEQFATYLDFTPKRGRFILDHHSANLKDLSTGKVIINAKPLLYFKRAI